MVSKKLIIGETREKKDQHFSKSAPAGCKLNLKQEALSIHTDQGQMSSMTRLAGLYLMKNGHIKLLPGVQNYNTEIDKSNCLRTPYPVCEYYLFFLSSLMFYLLSHYLYKGIDSQNFKNISTCIVSFKGENR